jgi:hypothetical protein
MLKLSKGRPKAIPIMLGGGAVAFVRPATSFEYDLAIAGMATISAGLIRGEEAAVHATNILGEEFTGADFTTKVWIEAAAQRIVLLELALLCTESWDGVVDDSDAPIPVPTKETLALLLRDNETAMRFNATIKSKVHEEIAEGNASAASPNGAAAAAFNSAPTAVPSVPIAPTV